MSEWISVEDRLPETTMGWSAKDVLCCCDYSIQVGRTHHGKWINIHNGPIKVTHWMPLPEPPKGERDEEL